MYGPRPAARLCNEKMALVWSRTAMVPLGRAESWPFLCLFEHGVRNLCACESLRTIAAVFFFSFFAVKRCRRRVFLLPTVRNVGAGEDDWFCGLQTPPSGRARSAWHSPREGSIVRRQLHVLRQNPATRMSLADQVAYEPNRLGLCVHGQMRSCNSWAEDLHCSASGRLHRDSDLTGSVDHAQLHTACNGPIICMDAERLNLLKNDRSGNGNGLELSERQEKHHFFPSKRNKEQTRHVLVGTINFHLMLVATRNLVELVRSRRRLCGVGDTPVEGPISFNGGRERRFFVEQKVDVCFLLCSDRLVHVIFVESGVLCSAFECDYNG